MNQLIDILGNTVNPGDLVVYPQMSGRSVQMVVGELLSYDGSTARIERERGSRWSATYSRNPKPVIIYKTENIVKVGGPDD